MVNLEKGDVVMNKTLSTFFKQREMQTPPNKLFLEKLWKMWLDTRKGVSRNEENWYNFVSEDCFDLTKNLKNIEDDADVWYLNHTKTTFS